MHPRDAVDSERASVLVVDDDVPLATTLARVLRTEGYDVMVAHDGAEALNRVEVSRPTVVLLDVQMPVMDGFAFLDAFRALPSCARIPVVVTTAARNTAEVHRRTERHGVARLLPKPFDLDVVVETIAGLANQVD